LPTSVVISRSLVVTRTTRFRRFWSDSLVLRSSSCRHLSAKVRSLHGFSHFVVFISMLLWCFFRLRIKPKSRLVIRVPLAEILHLACCVLFVVMNLSPPSSINEDVSPESHVSKSLLWLSMKALQVYLMCWGLGLGLGL
jgi:hypothetical protein